MTTIVGKILCWRSFKRTVVFLLMLPAGGMALAAGPQNMQAVLDRLVAENEGKGGGVARVTGGSGILWEGTAGRMAGPDSPPMAVNTPFEIASITKAVTSATVLRLVEDGKLKLDSTLAEVLPPNLSKGFDAHITVRQLLSHTSGLANYWDDGPKDRQVNNAFLGAFMADPLHFWSPEEILDYAREIPARRPGGQFHYSDTNYVLLGKIIEQTTKRPLHAVFREMIFDPLGMSQTWLTYHEPRRGRAVSHRYEGDEDMHEKPRQSADWAGGGLVSTTSDLDKFLRGLASGRLFHKPGTLDAMREAVPAGEGGISYGLGLYRVDLGSGMGELWGHDGHGNSFAYYWPQKDITFTGTLNQTENDWWPLVQSYIETTEKGVFMENTERSFEANLSTGWDSLFMDRGVNSLRDRGYGSGIYWTDLNVTWGLTENDFITLDAYNLVGTQMSYREFDATIMYTRTIGNLSLSFEYDFEYGYLDGNFFANELVGTAAYDVELGKLTVTPSLTYYFNLGPDSDNGSGMAKAASSFLLMRTDWRLPLYRDVLALEGWGAFGINFQYNTRPAPEEETVPFTGANNLECGIALPVRINKVITLRAYGAYSYALTDLSYTEPSTFWGGFSVKFTY